MIASVLKAQNVEKIALRPISRAKYFDFESLKTKRWNLREYTYPRGWSRRYPKLQDIFHFVQ